MNSLKLNIDIEIQKGRLIMDWARRLMPLTQNILDEMSFHKAIHIGLLQHIGPKVGSFCIELKNKGIQISVCSTNDFIDNDVVKALRKAGVNVFDSIQEFLNAKPDFILDDSMGSLFEFPVSAKGVVTLSAQSQIAATGLQKKGELEAPVINLNNIAITEQLGLAISNGQSCIMALLDITNLQIAGRVVVITGYNVSGQSIAAHATAMGARVTVVERDPILALKAVYDGYSVTIMDEIAPSCDVVFTGSESKNYITLKHIKDMPDGVILCETDRVGVPILFQNYLDSLGPAVKVRDSVVEYKQLDGKRIKLIAGGLAVDLAAAEGNTIENTDIYLALQLLAIKDLMNPKKTLDTKMHDLPLNDQQFIARAKLKSLGINIDDMI